MKLVQCSQEVRVPRKWSIEFLGEAVMDFHPRNVRKGATAIPDSCAANAQEVAEACPRLVTVFPLPGQARTVNRPLLFWITSCC